MTAKDAAVALGMRVNAHDRCPCPIHNGKDSNMRLYPDDKGYHCFVCGASGDVIHLVRAVNSCTFWEAVGWLNSAFNLGLDLDSAMDEEAAERALAAREMREKIRLERHEIRMLVFEEIADTEKRIGDMDDEIRRLEPRRANAEWCGEFIDAINRRNELSIALDELQNAMERMKELDR